MQQPQLPAELLKYIFELCFQETLKDLSLAGQQFRDIAQKILFRKIYICDDGLKVRGNAYGKATFLEESPHIVQLIRVVQVWIGSWSYLEPSHAILAQLRHETVQQLELRLASGIKTTVAFDNVIIRICNSPCLQGITLGNYPPSRALSWLQPSLTHLQLTLQPLQDPGHRARPERLASITLQSLSFVWDPPPPLLHLHTTGSTHNYAEALPQVLYFLDEERSKVDLSQLKSFHIPIQLGNGIGKNTHGLSECYAVLARCQDTLETLSLAVEWSHSTDMPPLDAWDAVSIGLEKSLRLRNFEVRATGWMEHAIHWIYTQLRAVPDCNNTLETLDISIVNKHLKTQLPYTSVWAVLDIMLSDRKRFPHFRVLNIRLVQLNLWKLTVDPRTVVSEIVARMPRLTGAGMLMLHHG